MLEFNLVHEKLILFSPKAVQVKALIDHFIMELKKVRPYLAGGGGGEEFGWGRELKRRTGGGQYLTAPNAFRGLPSFAGMTALLGPAF